MSDGFSRALAEFYYVAFCEQHHLDPDEQQSAREYEEWFDTYHDG